MKYGILLGCILSGVADAATLTIERLTWAGIKMKMQDTTVFIDAVGTDIWDGSAPEGLVPVTADTSRRYALITHAHNDHFDAETLREVLGERGYVICHESIATYVASRGLRVIPVSTYSPVERGGFLFMPVPAEDGFGDEQVSWIITAGEKRFLHAGDTLWHGNWSLLGKQYGPFDAVFLPINGARVLRDPMPESAAVMDPAQAVDAAILLRARKLVPIHFGVDDPPYYVEVNEPLVTAQKEAARRGLAIEHSVPGSAVRIGE
jgi:L-ascorbate metabolism protein UlaG (beta-lactamase superfamily)